MIDENKTIAAIDLGSNSFHMAIASLEHGEVRVNERLGEKVQLGAGLGKDGTLDQASIERAIDCLTRFAQRLKAVEQDHIRIVGTNALRVARNRKHFVEKAESILGVPIEVVSGREEARLIYLGVAHVLADDGGQRLVIDIGGGSTEFIIGQRFEALELESLHMGCVSYRDRFFPDGRVTEANFDRAVIQASRELLHIKRRYKSYDWTNCVGSSGSIKAVFQALNEDGQLPLKLTFKDMKTLRERLIKLGDVEKLAEYGVKKERLSIFPAGFAILYAAFKELGIEEIEYTSGALREGILYDMLGRISHEDVRDRTIVALQQRYGVDQEHTEYIQQLALNAFEQLRKEWGLQHESWRNLLIWACAVCDVGLSISHAQYHKHGAYLLEHSDLPGFSSVTQSHLALLVRAHRRKFPEQLFEQFPKKEGRALRYVCVILRLAVLFAADRDYEDISFELEGGKNSLSISFANKWLRNHPLSEANLDMEAYFLKKVGFRLTFC